MEEKVISLDVLKEMKARSMGSALLELQGSCDDLSRTLKTDDLKVKFFNEDSVVFESADQQMIQAGYSIADGEITFENVTTLVVDEESEKKEGKSIASNLFSAIIDEDKEEADKAFDKYINSYFECAARKSSTARRANQKEEKEENTSTKSFSASRFEKKLESFQEEYNVILENIIQELDWKTFSSEAKSALQDEGNQVVDIEGDTVKVIKVPTLGEKEKSTKWGKEHGKLLASVASTRKALMAPVDPLKGEKILKVKRLNQSVETDKIGDAIMEIVTDTPQYLLLSVSELAEVVAQTLENSGEKNWDTDLAAEIAEGILKVAYSVYNERAKEILSMIAASQDSSIPETAYEDFDTFKEVVESFFSKLDESSKQNTQLVEELKNKVGMLLQILESELGKMDQGDEEFATGKQIVTKLKGYLNDLENMTEHCDNEKVKEVVEFVDNLTAINSI